MALIQESFHQEAFHQEEFNKFVLNNKTIGFFEQPLTLVSGRKSHWYVNWRKVFNDPYLLEKVAQFVIAFSREKNLQPDCFYGVPEGATKLGIITQYLWAKSQFFQPGRFVLSMGRAKPKEHGASEDKYFVGMPQGKVIVLEDTTTTGESLLKTVQLLQEANIHVLAAINLTNRNMKRDDGTIIQDVLRDRGVAYYALSNALELLPQALPDSLPDAVVAGVEEEFKTYGVQHLALRSGLSPLSSSASFSSLVLPSPPISPISTISSFEQAKQNKTEYLQTKYLETKHCICLALDDLHSLEDVKQRVQELSPYVGMFKVGKELFTRFGPEVVRLAKQYGNVFLDLKYHDIPNTVRLASKAAAELGVSMITVHASGGLDMMKAAVEGAQLGAHKGTATSDHGKPKVIAVTVLTSIDQKMMVSELKMMGSVEDQVLQFALLAKKAGCDGIVCSAADLTHLKSYLPADFFFVTPGIQGSKTPAGFDQKRVTTPRQALAAGSSLLVIGRAITAAEDRVKAAQEILEDIRE